MNKIKIILGYILGIILTIFISSIVLLLILKFTIYKESYIKCVLVKTDYYNEVYESTLLEMKDYMTSSGLEEEILNDLFTKDDIKNDINNYFSYIYKGKIYNKDLNPLKEKLNNNINANLKKHNLDVTNRKELEAFEDDIIGIYNKEVTLYGRVNKLINKFYKIGLLINKLIIILGITSLIISIILILFKTKYLGSVFIGSSLILYFIRFLLFEKIDINNIYLFTEYISKVIVSVLLKIEDLLLKSSIYIIIFGLIICLIESINFKKNKYKKKNKRS